MSRWQSGAAPIGTPHIEVQDITRAVAFLTSEEARYIIGAVLAVTADKSGSATG
ncbi:hypothetical protein F8568_005675 [Actinomadura sp. LD22]|uniref:SDR family oxidoreductase n=1 Tax=Actinomadura physcomitrii TaxID=2650748 RepID=A0A6I4M6U1_9ACTN|nr:hypothetical protein [Actinomadura physcomitrii]MVZ99876.1 hypothetical protein [Actinomadura physcomitrii]